MRVKKYLHPLQLILCFLLAACLLAGCTNPSEKTHPPVGDNTSSIEGTQPPPEATQAPVEPIQQLTCFQAQVQPTIISAGNGCVLLCWMDEKSNTTCLNLVDIAADKVKHSVELEGWWSPRDVRFSDGCFVLGDVNSNEFRFFNQNLEDAGSFTPENTFGIFSHDRSGYFFLRDRVLFRTDLASGETAKVEVPYNLRMMNISGIHPTKDQIGLSFHLSPYGGKCGTAILDLSTGKLLMLQEDQLQLSFREDSVCLMDFDEQEMAYSYTYGSPETGFYHAAGSMFKSELGVTPIPGSEYLMSNGDLASLYRLGDEITVCSLADQGITGSMSSMCYIPEEKAIIGSVYQNGTSQLYVLRPSALSFSSFGQAESAESPLTVSPELGNSYWDTLSSAELPAELDEMRDFADRLEEQYGVHILLSNQCTEPGATCEYEIITTDQMNFPDEPQRIKLFLKALEKCMSMYPEGFFKQFQNSQGDGGICFMPVGKLVDDFNVVGICYERDEWNNIAVEVTADGIVGVLCHELWHATENKIMKTGYPPLNMDEWAALNPPGFQYKVEIDNIDPNPLKWTLESNGSEGVYFIDNYAMTNQHEDRARIMEFVMFREDYADAIKASPALIQKLQRMCDGIRAGFDTTGWGELRWERLLK